MPAHDIYRDHDMKEYRCRKCGQSWVSTANPATDCPGLKVYYWHAWPVGLYTKTQLGQKGYKPGQPVGVMRHRDRWMPLYRLEDATPKRQPTEAQRAALAKAQAEPRKRGSASAARPIDCGQSASVERACASSAVTSCAGSRIAPRS